MTISDFFEFRSFFFFFLNISAGMRTSGALTPSMYLTDGNFYRPLSLKGGNDGFGFILVLRHLALQVAFGGNLTGSFTEEGTCSFKFTALKRLVT